MLTPLSRVSPLRTTFLKIVCDPLGEDAPLFPVASPEDIVLAKLEWFRLGGETSERQWWDVVGVLRVAEDADRAYLRRWAAALNLTDLLERALVDAAS